MSDTDQTEDGAQTTTDLLTVDTDQYDPGDTVHVKETYSGGVFTAVVREDGVVREHDGDHAAAYSVGAYELVDYSEPDSDA